MMKEPIKDFIGFKGLFNLCSFISTIFGYEKCNNYFHHLQEHKFSPYTTRVSIIFSNQTYHISKMSNMHINCKILSKDPIELLLVLKIFPKH
jgi:uncharacterized protein (UPF0262 family)